MWRYFFVRASTHAFNGRALAGVPSGTPVSVFAGTPTLSCARPPQLALGAGFVTTKTEVAPNAQVHTRPYQAKRSPYPFDHPRRTARSGHRRHVPNRARCDRRGTRRHRGARACGGAAWLMRCRST
ncbi:hypothetical protein FG479_05705 [Burkholderia pseudomallei]|nr:hypothetical protein [Burkholderia pseudomallei]